MRKVSQKLRSVGSEPEPEPSYDYESEQRKRIMSRDWDSVLIAADRRKPFAFLR